MDAECTINTSLEKTLEVSFNKCFTEFHWVCSVNNFNFFLKYQLAIER